MRRTRHKIRNWGLLLLAVSFLLAIFIKGMILYGGGSITGFVTSDFENSVVSRTIFINKNFTSDDSPSSFIINNSGELIQKLTVSGKVSGTGQLRVILRDPETDKEYTVYSFNGSLNSSENYFGGDQSSTLLEDLEKILSSGSNDGAANTLNETVQDFVDKISINEQNNETVNETQNETASTAGSELNAEQGAEPSAENISAENSSNVSVSEDNSSVIQDALQQTEQSINQDTFAVNLTDNGTIPTSSELSVNDSQLSEAVDRPQDAGGNSSSLILAGSEINETAGENQTGQTAAEQDNIAPADNEVQADNGTAAGNISGEETAGENVSANLSANASSNSDESPTQNASVQKAPAEQASQEIYSPLAGDGFYSGEYTVTDACIETCELPKISGGEITVVIDGDVSFSLDSIAYLTTLPSIVQTADIPNQTLTVGEPVKINLDSYFETNGDIFYDVTSVEGFVFLFENSTLTITALENKSAKIFVYLANGDYVVKSNEIELNVYGSYSEELINNLLNASVNASIQENVSANESVNASFNVSSVNMSKVASLLNDLPQNTLATLQSGGKVRIMVKTDSAVPIIEIKDAVIDTVIESTAAASASELTDVQAPASLDASVLDETANIPLDSSSGTSLDASASENISENVSDSGNTSENISENSSDAVSENIAAQTAQETAAAEKANTDAEIITAIKENLIEAGLDNVQPDTADANSLEKRISIADTVTDTVDVSSDVSSAVDFVSKYDSAFAQMDTSADSGSSGSQFFLDLNTSEPVQIAQIVDNYVAVELSYEDLVEFISSTDINDIIPDSSFGKLTEESMNITGFDDVYQEYPSLNGSGITVCVLDTGVNISAIGINPDNVIGYNFIDSNSDFSDDSGHGTKVMYPLVRTAPGINLLVGKVLDSNGVGYASNIIAGLNWCQENGADVVSLSFGEGYYQGRCNEQPVAAKVNDLVTNGTIVVAAAGNNGWDNAVMDPACAARALSVTGAYKNDTLWEYSNFNNRTLLVAPALEILTVDNNGEESVAYGTSMAVPFVSGAAALVLQSNSSVNRNWVPFILINSGDIINSDGREFARLNILNAIEDNETNTLRYGNVGNVSVTGDNFTFAYANCYYGSDCVNPGNACVQSFCRDESTDCPTGQQCSPYGNPAAYDSYGICTTYSGSVCSSQACYYDEGSIYYSDCTASSYCYSYSSDSDGNSCDTNTAGGYNADYMCTYDGCTYGTVMVDASSRFRAGCDNSGRICDSAISYPSSSPFSADGICASGGCRTAGNNLCFTGSYYYLTSSGSCSNKNACDSSSSPSFSQDGIVCSNSCVGSGSSNCCSDSDCSSGQYCSAGYVCTTCTGSDCAGHSNCRDGTGGCCDAHNDCSAGWFCELSSVGGTTNTPNYYSCGSTEYPDFGEPHCIYQGNQYTCEPSYDIGRGYIVQGGGTNGYNSKTVGMNGNSGNYPNDWWGHQVSNQGGVGYKTTSADASLCFAYIYDPCSLGGENYYKTSSSTATWHSHADQSGEGAGCTGYIEWLDLGASVSGATYSLYQDAEADYYTQTIFFGWKITEAGTHKDGSDTTFCCEASDACVDDAPARGTGGSPAGQCYASGSHTRDANGDGNTDYCSSGQWYDCYDATDCAAGYSCVANDCVDNTAPTYVSATYVSGASWQNGNDLWVKGSDTVTIKSAHSDNIALSTSYFTWTHGCGPNGCGGAPNEIKSYITPPNSFSDWMADDTYLNINSPTCTDADANCGDTDNEWSWPTVVAGTCLDWNMDLYVFNYDTSSNGVGYTDTGYNLYIDNSNPSVSTDSIAGWVRGASVATSATVSDSRSGMKDNSCERAIYESSPSWSAASDNFAQGAASGTCSYTWDTTGATSGNTYYVNFRAQDAVGHLFTDATPASTVVCNDLDPAACQTACTDLGGSWNIGGEISGTTCCSAVDGDGNYANYKRGYPTDGLYKINWADNSGDDACCNAASDCVNGSTCFDHSTGPSGLNPGGADNTALCWSGRYEDCDQPGGYCAICGFGSLITSGDGSIGEYGSSTNGGNATDECCGDDAGESKQTENGDADAPDGLNDGTTACCSASTDCVYDGTCVDHGTVYGTFPRVGWCWMNTWHGGDHGSAECAVVGYTWATGGESSYFGNYTTGSETACCGDDVGENLITSAAGSDYSAATRCCNAATDCVNSGPACYSAGSFDTQSWLCVGTGNWQQCSNSGQAGDQYTAQVTGVTWYCTGNGGYQWRNTKTADGGTCVADNECSSGYCDNDGVGLADDNKCYTPADYNTHCPGGFNCIDNQDNNCEYDVLNSHGYAWPLADERAPGSYYDNRASASAYLGCPAYSSCSINTWTTCGLYDGDYSAGACAYTWTTVTTGDLETDTSAGCTDGVNCGDGTASNGFCCGDDSGENYRTFLEYYTTDHGTMDWGASQSACCNAATDMIGYNSQCVTANSAVATGASGKDKYAYPYYNTNDGNSGWLDCDGHTTWPSACTGTYCATGAFVHFGEVVGNMEDCDTAAGSTGNCDEAGNATYGCCGDDADENYRSGAAVLSGGVASCCNAATDCVDASSVCQATTYDAGSYICDAGTWDKDNGVACSADAECYSGDCNPSPSGTSYCTDSSDECADDNGAGIDTGTATCNVASGNIYTCNGEGSITASTTCATASSTDTDSGNVPLTAGTTTDYSACTAVANTTCNVALYADTCTSATALTEYYNNAASYASQAYTCAGFEVAASGDPEDDPTDTVNCVAGTGAGCTSGAFTTNAGSGGTEGCTGACGSYTNSCNFTEYYAIDSADACTGLDTCTAKAYDADTNSNTCGACRTAANWQIGGEIAGTACCGDDNGESNVSENGSTDAPTGFNDQTTSCCSAVTDCTYDDNCTATGSAYGTIPSKAYCGGGTWYGADTNSTTCIAVVGSVNWQIGGEVSGTACCGDDSGEYNNSENTYSVGIAFDNDQMACCSAASDAVAGSTCYTSYNTYPAINTAGQYVGLNPGGNDTKAYAYTNTVGQWLDCDGNGWMNTFCANASGGMCGKSYTPGSGDNSNCNTSQGGTLSGESTVFGEYTSLGLCGCCGDDTGENYRTEAFDASMHGSASGNTCCDTTTDCSNGTSCFATGAVTADADANGDNDYCNAGTWMDCSTDAQCGTGYYCNSNDCVLSAITITFVTPTPPDASRSINSNVSINVTVSTTGSAGVNISSCILEWNNTNVTMQMNATGSSVYCNFTKPTVDGGTYTYKVYANNTLTVMSNSSTRTIVENTPPTISGVVLNTTSANNYTTDNLTLSFSTSDPQSDNIFNFTDWRRNGTSIAVLNMPFDANVSSTAVGAVIDYSTFANNGQLGAGTEAAAPIWTAAGKIGGGYDFDGTNDSMLIADADSLSFTDGSGNDRSFSVSFWIKPDSTGDQWIINKRSASFHEWQTYIYQGNLSIALFSGGASAVAIAATVTNPLTTGQWNYVTMTYDGSESESGLNIYLNGTKLSPYRLVSGGSYAGMSSTTAPVSVGKAGWTSSFYLNGMLDEMKVFNRSLSPEQINQEYLAGIGNRSTNTIVNNETAANDNWTALVGACDGYECATSTSNGIIINQATTGPTCGMSFSSGGVYNLTENLTASGTTCFTVTGSTPNVVIDCKSYSIIGDYTSATNGILVSATNVTIRNCNVRNFYNDINLLSANNSRVYNVTFGTPIGLLVSGTSDGVYSNLSFTNITDKGIYVTGTSNNNTFTNISIAANGGQGIYINGGANNTFDCLGGVISGNSSAGTSGIYTSQIGTIMRNCFITGFYHGIYYYYTLNGYANNITINTTSIGIRIENTNYTLVDNSNAQSGAGGAMVVYSGKGVNITNGIFNTTTSGSGCTMTRIVAINSNDVRWANLKCYSTAYTGVGVAYADNVILDNVTGYTSSSGTVWHSGLYLYGVTGSLFKNGNFSGYSGLVLAGEAYTNNFSNNIFTGIFNGASSYAVRSYTGSTNSHNIFGNNTFSTSYSASGSLVIMESGGSSTNNTFYWNNFTSNTNKYVTDNQNGNSYNTTNSSGTVQGNYYYGIESKNVYDLNGDGWGDYGSHYPINATTWSTKWTGSGQDYGPRTSRAPNFFSATWNTSANSSAGSSNQTQIKLPLESGGTYDFIVNWGDGSTGVVTSDTDPDANHSYSSAGIKTINITGTITGFRFNYGGDKLKIMNITRWGDLRVGNSNGYFYGCSNMNFTGTDNLNLTGTTTLSGMFWGASAFNGNISGWDTGNVTVMSSMFSGASVFNSDISGWNTANVTNMDYMFWGASAFNKNLSNWNTSNVNSMTGMFGSASVFNGNITNWNTAKVTTMSQMFVSALAFNQNISGWNTGNVTDMSQMFVSALAFNQSIGSWNTGKVTNINGMFNGASAFNQNLAWNTGNVTNMADVFSGASAFNGDISGWNTINVTTMLRMFSDASAFNQNIGEWNTRNVFNMSDMFSGATSFNQNIGAWNVSNVTDATNMFDSVTLSTDNYDALLSGWGSRVEKNGTVFSGGNSKYSIAGVSGRNNLTTVKYNWTITDGGMDVSNAFSATWNTSANSSAGSSNQTQITLPLYNGGTYNFYVDWGDGSSDTITAWNDAAVTHNYASAGIKTINISGTIVGFRFNNGGDKLKIMNITQWGDLRVGNNGGYFYGCSNLNFTGIDNLNLTGTTNLSQMFYYSNFSGNISGWDVGNVSDMSYMFAFNSKFNQNISSWNTINVTTMSNMFQFASAFNQPIGSWNTGKVTTMYYMFQSATAFNQNISGWNVGNVTTMSTMFQGASAFNQNLSSWDTSKVTSMRSMFRQATSFNGNVSNWNVSKVTDMNGMFLQTSFNQPIGSWDVSNVTNMGQMFYGLSSFNQNLSGWNVSKVTDMSEMFYGNTVFNQNLSNWNTGEVTTTTYMFYGATAFNGNISNWNVSKVTDMSYMFRGATNFNQNISSWNAIKVKTMQGMFQSAAAFNQNIGSWDVSNVTTMVDMFNLSTSFNQNLGSWNVGNLTNATRMFAGVNLSIANYDALLSGWGSRVEKNGTVFSGGDSKYSSAGVSGRANLTGVYNWTITDGGINEVCGNPASGDWVVNATEVCRYQAIRVQGNLNITNGASLTLENVTLEINQTSNYVRNINVFAGGNFTTYNKTRINETGDNNTVFITIMGNVNLTNTSTSNQIYVHINDSTGTLYADDLSVRYLFYLNDPDGRAAFYNSYIASLYLNTNNTNITINSVVNGSIINNSIVSSNSNYTCNLTNTRPALFYVYAFNGTVNIINSTISVLDHWVVNGGSTYVYNSRIGYLLYYGNQTGVTSFIENWPGPTMVNANVNATTTGTNILNLSVVNVTLRTDIYALKPVNMTNSNVSYLYVYSGTSNYVNTSRIGYYYAYTGSTTHMYDSTITTLTYLYTTSTSYFQNTTLDSSSYNRFNANAILNFTQPADRNRIDLMYAVGAGTRYVYGYVNFTGIYTSFNTSGVNLYRRVPVNLTDNNSVAIPGATINLQNSSGSTISTATTDSTGIAWISFTEDENITQYPLYVGSVWKENITILEPSAPYGILLNVVVPVVSATELLPETPYNPDELVANVTCTDSVYNPLTVYWKVYRNGVEQAGEAGSASIVQGESTNVKNISNASTYVGDNWTVEFTCQNDFVNGTAVNTTTRTIINRAPELGSIVLNATSANNATTDNLTLYFSVSDDDGDAVYNFTDWRINGTSIAVLNMPFNENVSSNATGAVTDYSTYSKNGTLGGGVAASMPTWTANGKIGGGYTFDGSNDYIDNTDITIGYSPFTINVWVKLPNPASNNDPKIIDTGGSATQPGLYLERDNTYIEFYYQVAPAIVAYFNGGTALINDSAWHFLSYTSNRTADSLYIDGSLFSGNVAKDSTSVNLVIKNIGGVGTSSGRVNYFNGAADEVKIFNRSLSAEQIYQEYLAGLNNRSTNIIVSEETITSENWSALVGACDGYNCTTGLSNGVVINDAFVPFSATWNTSMNYTVGASNQSQITLPLESDGTYNFYVDWGDGSSDTITVWNDAAVTHNYATQGVKTINISGTIVGFRFANGGDRSKIMDITQWGDLNVGNNGAYFMGCDYMNFTGNDSLDLTGTTNLSYMFSGANTFDGNISGWDTSRVTDMSYMFYQDMSFDQNLSGWDVGNVTNMNHMFFFAAVFNQSIGSWNVGNVTDMSWMFSWASAFNQNLSGWDTNKVTNMSSMFSVSYFNQDISGWDVSNVIDMSSMFAPTQYFNQNISGWDVHNATDMSWMFSSAYAFNQNLSGWDVGKVTNMNSMFYQAYMFNQNLSGWDVGNVTNMQSMFEEARVFNGNISGWNTGNVANMYKMFHDAYVFNQSIGSWNVSSVTNMSFMFGNASSFNQNISGWNVGSVIDMSSMFAKASSFNQDISLWNTGNVFNMDGMFNNSVSFNQNLSLWNVSNLTNASNMFAGVTLSTANYDALLSGWGSRVEQNGTVFSGGSSKYSGAGSSGRNNLTGLYNWTITDGGSDVGNFTSTWNTITGAGLGGATNRSQIKLPLESGGTYNFVAYWGDGSSSNIYAWNSVNATHNYATQGGKTINIYGTIKGFRFNALGDRAKLYTITNWGNLSLGNNGGYFYGCTSLNTVPNSTPDLTGTNNFSRMFTSATSLNSANLATWDVSTITDMSYMFNAATGFNQNISNWSTRNVVNMNAMFASATAFNQSIGSWNVSNVTNMASMFASATGFNQNLSGWDTGKVTTMSGMFSSATKFNQDISGWDTGNVTTMANMFASAAAFNQNLSGWDTHNVTTISSMFNGASVFNGNITNWNTAKVTTMQSTFYNARLFNQNISGWNTGNVTTMIFMFDGAGMFNQSIGSWDTHNVTDMSNMFYDAANFTQNLSSWNTAKVTNMSSMFRNAILFNHNITNWDTANVTDTSYMFYSASAFNQNIGSWNTANVTDMSHMFQSSSVFNQNIGSWNTSKVTNMAGMFSGAGVFNQNIGSWNTGKVLNMSGMFSGMWDFNQDLNLWDVSNVTDMSSMFFASDAFNGNISSWSVGNVTNMNSMFRTASNFNQNIGGWNTGKVTDMNDMFNMAYSFNQNIGSWNTGNVVSTANMFYDATSFNQNIGSWNVSNVTQANSMFDGVTLSTANYNSLLSGWGSRIEKNGTVFSGGNSKYSVSGVSGRGNLTGVYNWTITDGGFAGALCTDVFSENSVYTMTQNDTTTGTCFNITAPNVTINCESYVISGNNSTSTYGVFSNQFNTTIKNCIISNFSEGIRYSGATDGTILNNSITETFTTGNGINILANAHRNTISQNTITCSGSVMGISITGGSNISIDCLGKSMYGGNMSGYHGVYSTQFNTTVKNCNINNFAAAIDLDGADNATIMNNNLSTTRAYTYPNGVALFMGSDSDAAVVTGNNMTATHSGGGFAILLLGGNDYNIFAGNNLSGKYAGYGGGFLIYGGGIYNTIANNTINGLGGSYAMSLQLGAAANRYNTIINNTFINATSALLFFDTGSTNNTVCLNNFSTTSAAYISDTNGINFYNCTYGGISQTQGNRYANVLNGSIAVYGSNDSSISGLKIGTNGAVPYTNATSNGKFACNFAGCQDNAPLTPQSNTAPVMVSAEILPNPANTTDTLQGQCNATDANNNNIRYYYQWYRNGVLNSSLSGNTTTFAQNVTRNVNNISAGMQQKLEVWILSCLASDDVENSSWVNSTGLNISNSPPSNVSLVYPGDGNDTFINRTPRFTWTTAIDADADALTYTINVSTSSSFTDSVYSKSGISTLYQDYDLPNEMSFGTYYWKVQAHDGTTNGSYSSTFNFTLVSSVNIQLITDNVTFGPLNARANNNTLTDNPGPLVIKSLSNTYVNISQMNISGSLWTTEPLNTSYWQIRVRPKADGSFNNATSRTVFFNATNVTNLVDRLNYTLIRNNVSIDMNVTVPMYEGVGAKTATLTFLAEVTT